MVILEVARNSVPADTAWPGVFLLGPNFLHHITSAEHGVDNVKGYVAGGIKYGVISYTEYAALNREINYPKPA